MAELDGWQPAGSYVIETAEELLPGERGGKTRHCSTCRISRVF
jgi:hypothetical protein